MLDRMLKTENNSVDLGSYFTNCGWAVDEVGTDNNGLLQLVSNGSESYLTFQFDLSIRTVKYEQALEVMQSLQKNTHKTKTVLLYAKKFSGCDKLKEFDFVFYEESTVRNLQRLSESNAAYQHIQLNPHNQLAFDKYIVKKPRRAAFVRATGTGKNYLLGRVIQEECFQKVLFMAPSQFIIQTQKTLVGSSADVEYMTYAKLCFADISKPVFRQYDLIIFDEFHRAGANEWSKSINTLIELNENAHLLGTSATHIRHLDGERNMLDEMFDGESIAELQLPEAIARGILPAPRYISGCFQIHDQIQKRENVIASASYSLSMKNRLLESLKGIALDWNKFKGVPELISASHFSFKGKYVVFCRDIEHLIEMKNQLSLWIGDAHRLREGVDIDKPTRCFEIHSLKTAFNNKRTLALFEAAEKSCVNLLFTVDMLNEGKHIKGIDGVILNRSTASRNVFYQQIGRAFSVATNRNPVIIDLVGNVQSIKEMAFITSVYEEMIRYEKRHFDIGLNYEPIEAEIVNFDENFGDQLFELDQTIETMNAVGVDLEKVEDVKEYSQLDPDFRLVHKKPLIMRTLKNLGRRYQSGSLDEKVIQLANSYGLMHVIEPGSFIVQRVKHYLTPQNKIPPYIELLETNKNLAYALNTQRDNYLKGRCTLLPGVLAELLSYGLREFKDERDEQSLELSRIQVVHQYVLDNGSIDGNSRHPIVAKALHHLRYKHRTGTLSSTSIEQLEAKNLLRYINVGDENRRRIERHMEATKMLLDSQNKFRDISISELRVQNPKLSHFLELAKKQLRKGKVDKGYLKTLRRWGLSDLGRKKRYSESEVTEIIVELSVLAEQGVKIGLSKELSRKKTLLRRWVDKGMLSKDNQIRFNATELEGWIYKNTAQSRKQHAQDVFRKIEAWYLKNGEFALTEELKRQDKELYKEAKNLKLQIENGSCRLSKRNQGELVTFGILNELSMVHKSGIHGVVEYLEQNGSLDGLSKKKTLYALFGRYKQRYSKGLLVGEEKAAMDKIAPYFKQISTYISSIDVAIAYQKENGNLVGFQAAFPTEYAGLNAVKWIYKNKTLSKEIRTHLEQSGLLDEDTLKIRHLEKMKRNLLMLEAYIKDHGDVKRLKRDDLSLYDKKAGLKKKYRTGTMDPELLKIIEESEYLSESLFK